MIETGSFDQKFVSVEIPNTRIKHAFAVSIKCRERVSRKFSVIEQSGETLEDMKASANDVFYETVSGFQESIISKQNRCGFLACRLSMCVVTK